MMSQQFTYVLMNDRQYTYPITYKTYAEAIQKQEQLNADKKNGVYKVYLIEEVKL